MRSLTVAALLLLAAPLGARAEEGLVHVLVRLKTVATTARASHVRGPQAPGTTRDAAGAAAAELAVRKADGLEDAAPVVRALERAGRKSFGTSVKGYEVLWVVGGVKATCSRDLVEELKRLPNVAEVLADPFMEFKLPESGQGSAEPWYLESVLPGGRDRVHGLDGASVRVGILDTGLAAEAPFRDKVAAYRDFTSNPATGLSDPLGHGTAVAGLVVQDGRGVAPGARLVVARVIERLSFSSEDRDREVVGAFAGRILSAMQWMLDPDGDPSTADAPKVVNNSWGFPENPYLKTDYFREAVALWRQAGVIPVFSAGNAKAGAEPLVNFPASYPEVIAVGAHDRAFQLASFSCVGPAGAADVKPDLVAPGVDLPVFTQLPGGSWGLAPRRGTSFAAPLVAGVVALLAQARPDLTPDEAVAALGRGAKDLGAPGKDRMFGYGALDAAGAVSAALDQVAWVGGAGAGTAPGGAGAGFQDPALTLAQVAKLAAGADQAAGQEAARRFLLSFADWAAGELQGTQHAAVAALAQALGALQGARRVEAGPLRETLRRSVTFSEGLSADERQRILEPLGQ